VNLFESRYGTPALKVRGKFLARQHPAALPELLERAWRLVASQSMIASFDADQKGRWR